MDLILDNRKQMVLINKTTHVWKLLFDLKVALFEELGLEVGENGQTSLKSEYFAIEDHIVPYTTGYLEVDVFDEYGDEPIGEEEGRVDL